MKLNKARYSHCIRPFTYILDIIIINVFAHYFLSENICFHLYISLTWIIIAINTSFYEVYRYTKPFKIGIKIIKQYMFFILINYVYMGVFNIPSNPINVFYYVSLAFIVVLFLKFFIFYFLKFFRINYGGNYRNVIVLGDKTSDLIDFFNKNLDYGYIVLDSFSSETVLKNNFQTVFEYIQSKQVHEVYISLTSFKDSEVNKIVSFSDKNLIKVKLLLNRKTVFCRNLKPIFYGNNSIVQLRTMPLDEVNNRIIKRIFDIIFSSLVIICILSWLTPIIAILIKLESNGSVFFKQKRTGLNNQDFMCYKYRSMHVNDHADKQMATKGDARITKIGSFLRKSSLDELPQFINVFLGDMSVVGPRPHMVSHTKEYAEKVDKFMVRHFIKPGITGLAQVSGYRGEIETKKDIVKRVRFDIYYAENWSIVLDIRIIIKTILNAIRGEEKAY